MSSIYCDRVYGEHPIGLWPISDHLTYLTLLDIADEDISTWDDSTASNHVTATSYTAFLRDRVPTFPGIGGTYKVTGETNTGVESGTTYHYTEIAKTGIISPNEINGQDNIDIGFWGFHSGLFTFFEVVLIGEDGEVAEIQAGGSKYVPARIVVKGDTWEPVYATFPAPTLGPDPEAFGVRIRAYYPSGAEYSYLIGGISIGQGYGSRVLLEEGTKSFAPTKASGLRHIDDLGNLVSIPEYGFGRDTAYVINKDNKLMATTAGIPMVYGDAYSISVLNSGDETLAMVVPGKGCFHDGGRNSELTLETWIRLNFSPQELGSHKLIGAVWSTDGLYLDRGFLVLSVNGQRVSYELKSVDGPQLVDVVFTSQKVSLFIDGEEIGSVAQSNVYPNSYNFNTDWIGVYGHDAIDLELGPIAIYPYAVSSLIAKRRYVWGQGVHTLTSSDYASFSRVYGKYFATQKAELVPVATNYAVITEDQSRYGQTVEVGTSKTYYRARIPLTTLARTDTDSGGRNVSTLESVHVSISSAVISGKAYVSFHKVNGVCSDARGFGSTDIEELIDLDSINGAHEISRPSIIRFNLDNPHLYEMDIHFIAETDSILPATLPTITLLSIADTGTWNEVGTQGSLKVFPYPNEGIYYSKKYVSPYVLGAENGSVMDIGRDSGIELFDGEISVSSRQYQTFLGLQLWVRADEETDDVTITVSAGEGQANFSLQKIGSGLIRFAVSESTLNTNYTLYQDGYRVSVPTLRNGVWTSIGVAFNSPIQPGINPPELVIPTGVAVKNIVFYGGDNIAKVMNFRTWAQALYSNNEPIEWVDWADKTWQEMYIVESDVPALDIGQQYRGVIGTNRYVVGEDEGVESKTLVIIDDSVMVTSKAIVSDGEQNLVISTPAWKGVGTFSA